MKNSELIEKTYLEAVKGINEDWFIKNNTKWYDYVVNLPINLRVTYLVVVFHNEVYNGGFHQYFVNGYGQFVKETIAALSEIDASQRSKLLGEAYKIVNKINLDDEDFRKQLLNKELKYLFLGDELFEPLEELDNSYYNIENEEIEELLGSYLKG
jgi:hypothetical protein